MKKIIILGLLFYVSIGYSQDNTILRVALAHLNDYNIEASEQVLKELKASQEKELILWNINVLKNGFSGKEISKVNYESNFARVLGNFKEAQILLSKDIPQDSLAYIILRNNLLYTKSINDTLLINFSSKKIIEYLYFSNRQQRQLINDYVKNYKQYANTKSDKATVLFYEINLYAVKHKTPRIEEFKDALKIAQNSSNIYIQAKLNQYIGIHFGYFLKQNDSSKVYTNRAIKLLEKFKGSYIDKEIFGLVGNLAQDYLEEGNNKKALQLFKTIERKTLPSNSYIKKAKLYRSISNTYKGLKVYDSALFYADLEKVQLKDLNEYKKAIALNETEEKYQNEKLRADNLEIETKRLQSEKESEQNRDIAFGLAGSLALGSIIAFLIFKNTKRKQRLAEQEKALESQKLATVLKDQELTAIDAMIEGQEKERQRIANDLHDDLGGLMATVKLHFNALKDKDSPELFDKTNSLIEEAYQKVRSVAHAKNSGVIAKQGLLKSVRNMADKISVSNKIKIEVLDYGLDNRLENSLELTLFRVIQELVTNVIKHAEASEVTIHLTNHEDSINIMVEDNGKGFNPSQITKTNAGMGISSIDKRVEHLDGKLTIESKKNKGTTVIIDIPL
ncbi:sensor histidine kinase [Winogradskyella sp.]|uniref:sensor histidine kinase n=1 Tax=Winogradskyella sp. TaxID=1883156 RepID=UPI0025E4A73B|nr:sensor histidine kinase [Winogradskyella sp.]